MKIRDATQTDWPDVAALLAELGRPDVRATAQEAGARRLYETYLQRADAVALVAELAGDVVGFVDLELRMRLNHRGPEAWIGELIVARGRRGSGVGTALLRAAEVRARAAGCWGVTLESANWREDAHRFYEREGWTQDALAFTKAISPLTADAEKEPETLASNASDPQEKPSFRLSTGVQTIPILPSDDLDKTAEYYARLGFEEVYRAPNEYLVLQRDGNFEVHFWLTTPVDPRTNATACYVRTNLAGDARAIYEEWAGADVEPGRLHPPTATDYGLLEFALVDLHGNLLRVGGRMRGWDG